MAQKARAISSSSSLIRIYHRLRANPKRGISRAEFLDVYGVDESASPHQKQKTDSIAKKFERVKDSLRDAGISFKHVERDGTSYYVHMPERNPLLEWELSYEDAGFLINLCRAWEGTELESSAHRIIRKVLLSVPSLAGCQGPRDIQEPAQCLRFTDDSHLKEIFTAFSEHKTVAMEYGDATFHQRENVSVWGIGYRYRNWYFAARYPSSSTSGGAGQAYMHRLERIGSMRINGSQHQQEKFVHPAADFDFSRMLSEGLKGFSYTVGARCSKTQQDTLLNSYGIRETAVKATARGLRILDNAAQDKNSQRAHQSRQMQQVLVEKLLQVHQEIPDGPSSWRKNTLRDRGNDVDRFIDMLLALRYLSENDLAFSAEGASLKPIVSLLGIDNGKPHSNLIQDFADVLEDYGSSELELFAPMMLAESAPANSHLSPRYELVDGYESPLYEGVPLSALERAMLFFTLSAAKVLYPADARVSRLQGLLEASYPQEAPLLMQSLIFAPEHQLLPVIRQAVVDRHALTFTYAGLKRTVDACSLIFENNTFYLHGLWREADTPQGWRNFALDRMENMHSAGPSRSISMTSEMHQTPHIWAMEQQANISHPYVRVKVHGDKIKAERRESIIRALKRRSTHAVRARSNRPDSPLIYHELHYYPGEDQAGLERIIHFVVSYEGALEILEPASVRSLMKNRLMSLLA